MDFGDLKVNYEADKSNNKKHCLTKETYSGKFDNFGVSKTITKHPKFDSNLTKGYTNDNPFALAQKASDIFLKSSEKPKKHLKNLNFPGNDFSFLQDFSQKADSVDTWMISDSKVFKKFSENCSKPDIYLSKFNNYEFKLKAYN